MDNLLSELGVSIASSAIYDFVKARVSAGVTLQQLTDDLGSYLNVNGQDLKAQKIISFLAENGEIEIENSKIYSEKSIVMGSAGSGSFSFGNNSTSTTPSTAIKAGPGAYIKSSGNAQIRQEEDGSISFYA